MPDYKNNPNCDGAACVSSTGEVRVLPIVGGANRVLCRVCFLQEMEFRKVRNREHPEYAAMGIPRWRDLKRVETFTPGC